MAGRTVVAASDVGLDAPKKITMDDLVTKGSGLPSRFCFYGPEGSGKTSIAAHFPKPVFLQVSGETGLDTLINTHQLPETPRFQNIDTYDDYKGGIDAIRHGDHDFKTLVIDTFNGVEILVAEWVLQTLYGGVETGNKGFNSYNSGNKSTAVQFRHVINELERIREERKMTIVCLAHTKVGKAKNTDDADHPQNCPDMSTEVWSLCGKWFDAILFLKPETVVVTDKDSGKVTSSFTGTRNLHTSYNSTYIAKNRHGLPEEIDMGSSGKEAYANLKAAVTAGRNITTK
tara:strand:+ start:3794 stop:4654 length:861 start_codon:yes stop_codon:yes gene_type:complete